MAFKKINERMELSGFFNREQGQVIQGIVKKHIAKEDGPFYIFELTEPCKAVVDKKSKKVVTKVGDYVGVAASSTLNILNDEHIGGHVRLRATGMVAHKTRIDKTTKKPLMMHTFDIEVDEAE